MTEKWSILIPVLASAPTLEEHDRHVQATLAGSEDAPSQSSEVGWFEAVEIESELSVQRETRPGAQVGIGEDVSVCARTAAPSLLPDPQADEVMIEADQPVEVPLEVEGRRRVARAAILKVTPGMAARKIDRLTAGVLKVTAATARRPQRGWGVGGHALSIEASCAGVSSTSAADMLSRT
ncbi:MAG: hypothetical protein JO023_00210 [Chloroflexi bacterium]|nr:hypothetical protein [Chloroflexota bacterium]